MSNVLENGIGLYMVGIRDGRPREAVEKHVGARYTQHSTGVPDGPDGFVTFFDDFLKRNPVRDIRVVRALQDGPFGFVQVYQSLNDGRFEYVTADFFDSDASGRVIEHWDVISELGTVSPAGHTRVNGVTEIRDRDRTQANKQLVRRRILEGLVHPVESVVYHEIVLCVGEGNFVATLCRATWNGEAVALVDVFRLEDGAVVEHWDNVEPVPSVSVNSGKF